LAFILGTILTVLAHPVYKKDRINVAKNKCDGG
jgi:hypothetical protein